MRVVCPQDVTKMLFLKKPGSSVGRGGQPNTSEELKEVVWLVTLQTLLRRKTNESWTDNHLNVLRLVGRKEMSWLQQRRGHRETLVLLWSAMEGGRKPDPRGCRAHKANT